MATNQYDFFLNASASVIQYETIELSHPNFSQVFYFVRNAVEGITATLEDATVVDFEYLPMKISEAATTDDLDYKIRFELGDVGEIAPQELDRVLTANGFLTKPTAKYRTFRSDNLTAPMLGPKVLQITEFTFTKEGCGFEAAVPRFNINRTGRFYTIADFPMLRGLL